MDGKALSHLLTSEEAKGVLRLRQEELLIHALAVGLRGASTLTPTLRVPPAVNRTAGIVRQLAMHARTNTTQSRKFPRLFSDVQSELREAVGSDLLKIIEDTEGAIKLVTDAPLEWLPVGVLPLGLKYDCSRTTATPGNLLAGELLLPELLPLRTLAFSEVLVVRSFEADDPIKDMIPSALNLMAPTWRDRLTIRSVIVHDETDFCEALNAYYGCIMIFDGPRENTAKTQTFLPSLSATTTLTCGLSEAASECRPL